MPTRQTKQTDQVKACIIGGTDIIFLTGACLKGGFLKAKETPELFTLMQVGKVGGWVCDIH